MNFLVFDGKTGEGPSPISLHSQEYLLYPLKAQHGTYAVAWKMAVA